MSSKESTLQFTCPRAYKCICICSIIAWIVTQAQSQSCDNVVQAGDGEAFKLQCTLQSSMITELDICKLVNGEVTKLTTLQANKTSGEVRQNFTLNLNFTGTNGTLLTYCNASVYNIMNNTWRDQDPFNKTCFRKTEDNNVLIAGLGPTLSTDANGTTTEGGSTTEGLGRNGIDPGVVVGAVVGTIIVLIIIILLLLAVVIGTYLCVRHRQNQNGNNRGQPDADAQPANGPLVPLQVINLGRLDPAAPLTNGAPVSDQQESNPAQANAVPLAIEASEQELVSAEQCTDTNCISDIRGLTVIGSFVLDVPLDERSSLFSLYEERVHFVPPKKEKVLTSRKVEKAPVSLNEETDETLKLPIECSETHSVPTDSLSVTGVCSAQEEDRVTSTEQQDSASDVENVSELVEEHGSVVCSEPSEEVQDEAYFTIPSMPKQGTRHNLRRRHNRRKTLPGKYEDNYFIQGTGVSSFTETVEDTCMSAGVSADVDEFRGMGFDYSEQDSSLDLRGLCKSMIVCTPPGRHFPTDEDSSACSEGDSFGRTFYNHQTESILHPVHGISVQSTCTLSFVGECTSPRETELTVADRDAVIEPVFTPEDFRKREDDKRPSTVEPPQELCVASNTQLLHIPNTQATYTINEKHKGSNSHPLFSQDCLRSPSDLLDPHFTNRSANTTHHSSTTETPSKVSDTAVAKRSSYPNNHCSSPKACDTRQTSIDSLVVTDPTDTCTKLVVVGQQAVSCFQGIRGPLRDILESFAKLATSDVKFDTKHIGYGSSVYSDEYISNKLNLGTLPLVTVVC